MITFDGHEENIIFRDGGLFENNRLLVWAVVPYRVSDDGLFSLFLHFIGQIALPTFLRPGKYRSIDDNAG